MSNTYYYSKETNMSSLTKQMEELKKQQEILAKQIEEEEIRTKKLNELASINRLEALIEPITEYLDWVDPREIKRMQQNGHQNSDYYLLSRRGQIINKLERIQRNRNKTPHTVNKYIHSDILANEEIFVTLLGIIKKQDARITELETIIQRS